MRPTVRSHKPAMTKRQRVDRLLVERGLFESRAKAQAAIAAGLVSADGLLVGKASDEIPANAKLQASAEHPWVSRGGIKLAAALDHFGFDPKGRVCLDVGASTGGFTHVLVERGARRVYAVDVGHDQLHHSLRKRTDIVCIEETDIRALTAALLREPPVFIVIDVSFISLKLVLPAALALATRPAQLLALIKPQFEMGRGHRKKGIVRDPQIHTQVCEDMSAFVTALGCKVLGVIPSPVAGGDGNREFFIGAEHD